MTCAEFLAGTRIRLPGGREAAFRARPLPHVRLYVNGRRAAVHWMDAERAAQWYAARVSDSPPSRKVRTMKGKLCSLLFGLAMTAMAFAVLPVSATGASPGRTIKPAVVQLIEFTVSVPFSVETLTCESWAANLDWTGSANIEGSKCSATGPVVSHTSSAGNGAATFGLLDGSTIALCGCLVSNNGSGGGTSYIVQYQVLCP